MDYQRAAQADPETPLVSVTTWRDNQGKAYGVQNATHFVVLESLKGKARHPARERQEPN